MWLQVLDFAPGDFVEMLTPSNDWEVAQVNDVSHTIRVFAYGSHLDVQVCL